MHATVQIYLCTLVCIHAYKWGCVRESSWNRERLTQCYRTYDFLKWEPIIIIRVKHSDLLSSGQEESVAHNEWVLWKKKTWYYKVHDILWVTSEQGEKDSHFSFQEDFSALPCFLLLSFHDSHFTSTGYTDSLTSLHPLIFPSCPLSTSSSLLPTLATASLFINSELYWICSCAAARSCQVDFSPDYDLFKFLLLFPHVTIFLCSHFCHTELVVADNSAHLVH